MTMIFLANTGLSWALRQRSSWQLSSWPTLDLLECYDNNLLGQHGTFLRATAMIFLANSGPSWALKQQFSWPKRELIVHYDWFSWPALDLLEHYNMTASWVLKWSSGQYWGFFSVTKITTELPTVATEWVVGHWHSFSRAGQDLRIYLQNWKCSRGSKLDGPQSMWAHLASSVGGHWPTFWRAGQDSRIYLQN